MTLKLRARLSTNAIILDVWCGCLVSGGQTEDVGEILRREFGVETGLQSLFPVDLRLAPRQHLAPRIVLQVFELVLAQLAIEALPGLMQLAEKGVECGIDRLAQPGYIQALENVLFLPLVLTEDC